MRANSLDEVLHYLRMSGTFYCTAEYSAPWALSLPPTGGEARFHVITAGRAFLRMPGIEPIALERGDLVLLPHGAGHELGDQPSTPVLPESALEQEHFSDHYAHFRYGRGDATRLVCVKASFDDPVSARLISFLPKIIHVPAADMHTLEAVNHVVRLIAQEARELRPGGETIIKRLADILIVQAIRWWVEREPIAQSGWLHALSDKKIGRVITLIHRDPARPWTITSLATEVGMSRSVLAARFKELVGVSVMRYLVGWRMQLALSSLRREDVDIGQLAARLGYESQSAFNRAFKRYIGTAPGAARERDDVAHLAARSNQAAIASVAAPMRVGSS